MSRRNEFRSGDYIRRKARGFSNKRAADLSGEIIQVNGPTALVIWDSGSISPINISSIELF